MAGSQVNDYSIGDSNIESVMLTLDKTFFGKTDSTVITNMSSTAAPEIPAGAVAEVNGALYKFDAAETITGTPSDGETFIKLIPSGASLTAEYTNTAPTWSDTKQGYYGTGGAANHKYIGGCYKSGANYGSKFVYRGFEKVPKRYESINTLLNNQALPQGASNTFNFTITHSYQIEAVLSVNVFIKLDAYPGIAPIPSHNFSAWAISGNTITGTLVICRSDAITSPNTADINIMTSIVGY